MSVVDLLAVVSDCATIGANESGSCSTRRRSSAVGGSNLPLLAVSADGNLRTVRKKSVTRGLSAAPSVADRVLPISSFLWLLRGRRRTADIFEDVEMSSIGLKIERDRVVFETERKRQRESHFLNQTQSACRALNQAEIIFSFPSPNHFFAVGR